MEETQSSDDNNKIYQNGDLQTNPLKSRCRTNLNKSYQTNRKPRHPTLPPLEPLARVGKTWPDRHDDVLIELS